MTQSYIEGIWKVFPTLFNNNSHTNYVEHEEHHLRYVYQIVDDIYIVILTNHLSNIIRDRQLVLNLSRMISDICKAPSLDNNNSIMIDQVKIHTFDILMCLDELVNQAGYEDDSSNIKNQLGMFSIQEEEEENDRKIKEKKVQKIRFEKAKQFALQKMEARRTGKRFDLDSQSPFYY